MAAPVIAGMVPLYLRNKETGAWYEVRGAMAPPIEVYVGATPPGVDIDVIYADTTQVSIDPPYTMSGPPGPQGEPGVASIIVGDFGEVAIPANLPPTGLIPINFDGTGKPAVAYQMELGQSLLFDKLGDPLDGHLFQYVSNAVVPEGWIELGNLQGPAGAPGDPGVDGIQGEQGTTSRVVFRGEVSQVTSHATAGTMIDLVTGTIEMDPGRDYHFFAGWRCIADAGAVATANAAVYVNGVILPGHDLVTTPDTGLWGSFSQSWVRRGSDFVSVPTTVEIKLQASLTVASKLVYSPRLYVVEHGPFVPNDLTDADARYLQLTGGTVAGPLVIDGNYMTIQGDGYGILFQGDGRIYKRSGGGLVIRQHADVKLQVEDTAGTSRWTVLDTQNILGTSYPISWLNNWKGSLDIKVNPAMVSIRFFQVTRGVTQNAYAESHMFNLPSGVPVPWGQIIVPVVMRESDWTSFPGAPYIDIRTNGQVWCRMTGDGLEANNRYIETIITWAR